MRENTMNTVLYLLNIIASW